MISFTKVRELHLSAPLDPGRGAFISAASGLVCLANRFYVVADDELHLCSFSYDPLSPGEPFPLFEGSLPLEPKARKKEKPDFEALVLLPASPDLPDRSLLALPSGSKRHRSRGSWMALQSESKIVGCAQTVDCTALYEKLSETFSDLNIEGAVIRGKHLILLQRGNGDSPNALIELDLNQVLEGLKYCRIAAYSAHRIIPYDLGTLGGVKYSFTDATIAPDGNILFIAVAEDSQSTYDDGICSGSALGMIDSEGRVRFQAVIHPLMKAEGIGLRTDPVSGQVQVLLVTDGDNPLQAAELYACDLDKIIKIN